MAPKNGVKTVSPPIGGSEQGVGTQGVGTGGQNCTDRPSEHTQSDFGAIESFGATDLSAPSDSPRSQISAQSLGATKTPGQNQNIMDMAEEELVALGSGESGNARNATRQWLYPSLADVPEHVDREALVVIGVTDVGADGNDAMEEEEMAPYEYDQNEDPEAAVRNLGPLTAQPEGGTSGGTSGGASARARAGDRWTAKRMQESARQGGSSSSSARKDKDRQGASSSGSSSGSKGKSTAPPPAPPPALAPPTRAPAVSVPLSKKEGKRPIVVTDSSVAQWPAINTQAQNQQQQGMQAHLAANATRNNGAASFVGMTASALKTFEAEPFPRSAVQLVLPGAFDQRVLEGYKETRDAKALAREVENQLRWYVENTKELPPDYWFASNRKSLETLREEVWEEMRQKTLTDETLQEKIKQSISGGTKERLKIDGLDIEFLTSSVPSFALFQIYVGIISALDLEMDRLKSLTYGGGDSSDDEAEQRREYMQTLRDAQKQHTRFYEKYNEARRSMQEELRRLSQRDRDRIEKTEFWASWVGGEDVEEEGEEEEGEDMDADISTMTAEEESSFTALFATVSDKVKQNKIWKDRLTQIALTALRWGDGDNEGRQKKIAEFMKLASQYENQMTAWEQEKEKATEGRKKARGEITALQEKLEPLQKAQLTLQTELERLNAQIEELRCADLENTKHRSDMARRLSGTGTVTDLTEEEERQLATCGELRREIQRKQEEFAVQLGNGDYAARIADEIAKKKTAVDSYNTKISQLNKKIKGEQVRRNKQDTATRKKQEQRKNEKRKADDDGVEARAKFAETTNEKKCNELIEKAEKLMVEIAQNERELQEFEESGDGLAESKRLRKAKIEEEVRGGQSVKAARAKWSDNFRKEWVRLGEAPKREYELKSKRTENDKKIQKNMISIINSGCHDYPKFAERYEKLEKEYMKRYSQYPTKVAALTNAKHNVEKGATALRQDLASDDAKKKRTDTKGENKRRKLEQEAKPPEEDAEAAKKRRKVNEMMNFLDEVSVLCKARSDRAKAYALKLQELFESVEGYTRTDDDCLVSGMLMNIEVFLQVEENRHKLEVLKRWWEHVPLYMRGASWVSEEEWFSEAFASVRKNVFTGPDGEIYFNTRTGEMMYKWKRKGRVDFVVSTVIWIWYRKSEGGQWTRVPIRDDMLICRYVPIFKDNGRAASKSLYLDSSSTAYLERHIQPHQKRFEEQAGKSITPNGLTEMVLRHMNKYKMHALDGDFPGDPAHNYELLDTGMKKARQLLVNTTETLQRNIEQLERSVAEKEETMQRDEELEQKRIDPSNVASATIDLTTPENRIVSVPTTTVTPQTARLVRLRQEVDQHKKDIEVLRKKKLALPIDPYYKSKRHNVAFTDEAPGGGVSGGSSGGGGGSSSGDSGSGDNPVAVIPYEVTTDDTEDILIHAQNIYDFVNTYCPGAAQSFAAIFAAVGAPVSEEMVESLKKNIQDFDRWNARLYAKGCMYVTNYKRPGHLYTCQQMSPLKLGHGPAGEKPPHIQGAEHVLLGPRRLEDRRLSDLQSAAFAQNRGYGTKTEEQNRAAEKQQQKAEEKKKKQEKTRNEKRALNYTLLTGNRMLRFGGVSLGVQLEEQQAAALKKRRIVSGLQVLAADGATGDASEKIKIATSIAKTGRTSIEIKHPEFDGGVYRGEIEDMPPVPKDLAQEIDRAISTVNIAYINADVTVVATNGKFKFGIGTPMEQQEEPTFYLFNTRDSDEKQRRRQEQKLRLNMLGLYNNLDDTSSSSDETDDDMEGDDDDDDDMDGGGDGGGDGGRDGGGLLGSDYYNSSDSEDENTTRAVLPGVSANSSETSMSLLGPIRSPVDANGSKIRVLPLPHPLGL